MNPMLTPRLTKVTLNIGVGKAGEPLDKACTILKNLTGQTPVRAITHKRIPNWDLRPGVAIGCKVTLRGKVAMEFLKKALETVGFKLKTTNFDNTGNFAFGIKEHIDLPGVKYDPNLGVYGIDVCTTLEKPGYRVSRRRNKRKVGKKHQLKKEDAIKFAEGLGAKVE